MKIVLTIVFAGIASLLMGQQQEHYTQFMYNKLALNAGYAGSADAPCATLIYRHQWTGLEGAPKTQLLSYHMPLLNKRVGAGLNLVRNTIGISQTWTLDGAYAYRIRMGNGVLGLGVQGSVQYLGVDYTDPRLVGTQPLASDDAITLAYQQKYVPNFGAGAYFQSNRFFAGLSAPRLLKNNIDFSTAGTVISREELHAYFMTGLLIDLSDNVQFQPQALFKYANNSPFDADFNAMFIFNKKYAAGLSYRTGGNTGTPGESLDFLLNGQITDNLLLGFAYDFTLSDIRTYESGSIEAMVRYCFGSSQGVDLVNPRFF